MIFGWLFKKRIAELDKKEKELEEREKEIKAIFDKAKRYADTEEKKVSREYVMVTPKGVPWQKIIDDNDNGNDMTGYRPYLLQLEQVHDNDAWLFYLLNYQLDCQDELYNATVNGGDIKTPAGKLAACREIKDQISYISILSQELKRGKV